MFLPASVSYEDFVSPCMTMVLYASFEMSSGSSLSIPDLLMNNSLMSFFISVVFILVVSNRLFSSMVVIMSISTRAKIETVISRCWPSTMSYSLTEYPPLVYFRCLSSNTTVPK